RGLGVFLGSTAVGLLVPLVLTTAAWAQTGAPQASVVQAIATFRTVQDMQAAEAAHPAIPVVIPLNLPTTDFEQYRALKATAGPAAGEVKEEAGLAPVPEAIPTLGPLHCNGIGENAPVAGGVYPPDTHGAVGANHYCQVVNIAIRCYSRTLSGNCP